MPDIIDTGTDKLIASIDGAIGRIIFNKPDKHNAVCMQMWKALGTTIEYFENNDSIRVIILSGSGEKSFVSGADISEFDQSRSTNEDVIKYDEVAEGATQKIYESSKPTIAMIQGYCIGGGLGIAVACDIRIASENSIFAIPAAKLGLGYRSRNLERVINLVGPSFASEILITARRFNVKEAAEMGLVNRVIKTSELRSYCENYANIIASNAPMTIFAARTAVREIKNDRGKDTQGYLDDLVNKCFSSNDYAEGRKAFQQKRKPLFKGK